MAEDEIAHWICALKDKDWQVREAAAEAFDHMGWAPKDPTSKACYYCEKMDWNSLTDLEDHAFMSFL